MIELNCIKFGDCFTPEDLVTEIYSQCPDLSPPIPIKVIAKAAGITHIVSRDMTLEGMLVADDGKTEGVILYNSASIEGRQRFTIAHELGHFLLMHHNSNQHCVSNDIGPSRGKVIQFESEANTFAQKLLMPDHLILKAINNLGPSIESIKEIADSFHMSFSATANKCATLSQIPFALIYSKDSVVNYCWQNYDKSPFKVLLKKGDNLPPASLGQAKLSNEISEIRQIQTSAWGIKCDTEECMINEQLFNQESGYQVTLLFQD